MDYIMKSAEAMDIAEKAIALRLSGEKEKALQFFREAFELEKEVALATLQAETDEATIAIALQSASALALDAEMFRDAEQLACLGLSRNPPEEIAQELREILLEAFCKQGFQGLLEKHEHQFTSV